MRFERGVSAWAGGLEENSVMAREFKAVDRDTPMLLPPDLREWLPEDHLAYLVLGLVDQLDLSAVIETYRRGGTGREAFDPAMLTGLLIYAYAQGVRSSRQIERGCVTDVAMRMLAAQQRPDHTTIARFRQRNAAALADLLGQVLRICHRAGMGRVGIVAVDGSKIAGQASPRTNYTEATLRKMAADIVDEAAVADEAEDVEHGPDHTGDELPETLRPGADRAARIRQALQQVEEEREAARAEDVTVAERKTERARRAAARERRDVEKRRQGRTVRADRGTVDEIARVRRADAHVAEKEDELAQARAGQGPRMQRCKPTANVSDPDSHLMFVRGKGFLQGFNAQLVVTDDHLILATDVCTHTNDARQYIGMVERAVANAAVHLDGAVIGTVVADAGYCTQEALTAPGPDRLIATGRKPEVPSQTGKSPAIAAMAKRLVPDTPGRAVYQRRQATVEPVIGHLKDRIGLRRFMGRGLDAARNELAFAATVHNIRRLAVNTS